MRTIVHESRAALRGSPGVLALALATALSAAGCRDVGCPADTQVLEGRCVDPEAVGLGPDGCVLFRYYVDADGDGHGEPDTYVDACEPPAGHVRAADDCDDACPACWTGAAELCDGVDNDCDGTMDADLTQPCGLDVGACQQGVQRCTLGIFGACEGAVEPAFAEVCDGSLDEDCDGEVDEGCGCTPGETRACGTAEGPCELGMQTCTEAGVFGPCETTAGPSAEVCNGEDDDCDGMVDEQNPGGGATCGLDAGLCTPGVTDCQGGAILCRGETAPVDEVCNEADDDCDGDVDEGTLTTFYRDADEDTFGDPNRTADTCSAPPGYVDNAKDCDDACPTCHPLADDICDAIDNDCANGPDDAFACAQGLPTACTTTCGSIGTGTCSATCEMPAGGSCTPPAEVCNYADDDCDGHVDEDVKVVASVASGGLSSTDAMALAPWGDGYALLTAGDDQVLIQRLDADGRTVPQAYVGFEANATAGVALAVLSDTEVLIAHAVEPGGSCTGSGVSACAAVRYLEWTGTTLGTADAAFVPSADDIFRLDLAVVGSDAVVAFVPVLTGSKVVASRIGLASGSLGNPSSVRQVVDCGAAVGFDIEPAPTRDDRVFLTYECRANSKDQIYLGYFDPAALGGSGGAFPILPHAVVEGLAPHLARTTSGLALAYYQPQGPRLMRLSGTTGVCPNDPSNATCVVHAVNAERPSGYPLTDPLALVTEGDEVSLAYLSTLTAGNRLYVTAIDAEDAPLYTEGPIDAPDTNVHVPVIAPGERPLFGYVRYGEFPNVFELGCGE